MEEHRVHWTLQGFGGWKRSKSSPSWFVHCKICGLTVGFSDDIRKYWEETKGELTREYKLRHREASRRLKPFKGAIKSTDF